MEPPAKPPSSEREQTDESLRLERETADQALEDELAALDETADAVITLARTRADEVLATARAKTDQQSVTIGSPSKVAKARAREDQAVDAERSDADDALRAERAEQADLLSIERAETDKDLLRERARADDALAMRDEFLAVVSHDLRNMLHAMIGSATMIATIVADESVDAAPSTPHLQDVVKHAQRIQRSGARMNRLIGDLVDVASLEAGVLAVTREVGDPTVVVTEAVEAFQAQATHNGVTLTADIAPGLGMTAFDPARILQVLGNLLSNAIKFTPPQGTVTVQVERVDGDIRFCIRDSGRGIPADKLEAVFTRFLQLAEGDRRGLGLGLYISKGIVQGHGGRIWAESSGKGSTFCFTLPANVSR